MGWLMSSAWATKAMVVEELTSDKGGSVTLAKAVRGNVLWAVQKAAEDAPFIACYLLRCDRGYGWGYKDMAESMHPYYYDCPLGFLELAPEASPDWRKKVRAAAAAKAEKAKVARALKAKLAVGCRVKMNEGCSPSELELVEIAPVLVGRSSSGTLYRFKKRHIAAVL